MSETQKQLCPDVYRRLKLASLRAGEAVGTVTVYKDDPARRVNRWLAK